MSDVHEFQDAFAGFAVCFLEWATRWRYNKWVCFHLRQDFLFWISWKTHDSVMMNPLMENTFSCVQPLYTIRSCFYCRCPDQMSDVSFTFTKKNWKAVSKHLHDLSTSESNIFHLDQFIFCGVCNFCTQKIYIFGHFS